MPFFLPPTRLTTARLLFTPRSFLKTCWHCPMYRIESSCQAGAWEPSPPRRRPALPSHCPPRCPPTVFSCLPERFAVPEIRHMASRLHTPGHVVPMTGIISSVVHLSCLSSKTEPESLP